MPLPIIQRELHLAARRRATIWFRISAAAIAVLIGLGGVFIMEISGGAPAVGKALFGTLTWLCLAGVLAAGLFLTSDALSEEKRAGTLGLLFLTDLRGYDVVLGKLAATSLRGFEALLAMFPVLAITLLAGGVQPAEFWKACLALVNVLFCSNAAGLFASATSREHLKAVGRTVFLMFFLLAGGPILDAAIASYNNRPFEPFFSLGSPVFAFTLADAFGANPFWKGLLISHAVGWVLLGITCLRLPHWWQERPRKSVLRRKPGTALIAPRRLGRWLERNPVQWLAVRERRQALGIWFLALAALGFFLFAAIQLPQEVMMFWNMIYRFLMPILYIWISVRTCSFFLEARRSGFFELLMVSPVGPAQIVRGFWVAFLRVFGPPLVLLLALQVASPLVGGAEGFFARMGAQSDFPMMMYMLLTGVAGFVSSTTNLAAIVWFGMWMGLVSKNTGTAALKTVAFVIVLPWFCAAFLSALSIPLLMLYPAISGVGATGGFVLYPMVSAVIVAILYIVKNVAFIVWSRRKLLGSFRAEISSGPVALRLAPPPYIPPPPVLPRAA